MKNPETSKFQVLDVYFVIHLVLVVYFKILFTFIVVSFKPIFVSLMLDYEEQFVNDDEP